MRKDRPFHALPQGGLDEGLLLFLNYLFSFDMLPRHLLPQALAALHVTVALALARFLHLLLGVGLKIHFSQTERYYSTVVST